MGTPYDRDTYTRLKFIASGFEHDSHLSQEEAMTQLVDFKISHNLRLTDEERWHMYGEYSTQDWVEAFERFTGISVPESSYADLATWSAREELMNRWRQMIRSNNNE